MPSPTTPAGAQAAQPIAGTAGPWFVSQYSDFHIMAGTGDDQTGIATTDTSRKSRHGCISDEQAASNAAHIVRCVNAFPALVAAVQSVVAKMIEQGGEEHPWIPGADAKPMLADLQSLLASLEQEAR